MELNPELLREYLLEGIEHAPDAVYWIDHKARFRYANQTATNLLGYTRDEFISMTVADINPAVTMGSSWDDIWDLVDTRESVTFDSEHRHKDGSLIPVEVTARMITLEEESLVLAFARDESDRYRAEVELQQSQQRLQSILDNTSAVVFMKDVDGRYLLVNRQYLNLFSLEGEKDIIGKTDFEVFEEPVAKAFRQADERVVAEGKRMEMEELAPHEDGLHTYISTKFPLRNEAGEIFAIGGIATDITPRKRAMEQADLQARRIRKLYEVASRPGLTIDQRIEEGLATGCDLLGMETGVVSRVTSDVCRVRNLWPKEQSIVRGDEMPLEETYSALAYRAKDVIAIENFGETEYREISVYDRLGLESCIGSPVDVGEEVFGAVMFFATVPREQPFDETDRDFVQLIGRWVSVMIEAAEAAQREQNYAEDLERSNRDLQDFAYVASHDLKEPLRMISGFADLLAKKYAGELDEEGDEFIHHLTSGAKRMQGLIDDLLLYSRIGTRGRKRVAISLEKTLSDALHNLTVVVRESGARIENKDLPMVMGDPGQLIQLFQNLIANAIKFCGDDSPRIEVFAQPMGAEEELIEIGVRDNGIGISEESCERIFNIFHRVNRDHETGGSGIGLAICRRIVERHGGTIRVESKLGAGSTFYFTLKPGEQDPSI